MKRDIIDIGNIFADLAIQYAEDKYNPRSLSNDELWDSISNTAYQIYLLGVQDGAMEPHECSLSDETMKGYVIAAAWILHMSSEQVVQFLDVLDYVVEHMPPQEAQKLYQSDER